MPRAEAVIVGRPDRPTRRTDTSDTFERLAELNPSLDEAELMLLSHAVHHHRDMLITYRSRTGGQTMREIRSGRANWMGRGWFRGVIRGDAQREFTVANIESVAPAG